MSISRTAELREAERYMHNVETARRALDKVTYVVIRDLLRRRDQTTEADGYPSGGTSGPASADQTTSTEAAALRGLTDDEKPHVRVEVNEAGQCVHTDDWERHVIKDPLGQAIDDALANIVEMAAMAKQMAKRVDVVIYANEKEKGRVSSLSQCQCCEANVTGVGNDRIRSGYCRSCHTAWVKDGKPPAHNGDRMRWEQARQVELKELAAACREKVKR